MKFKSLFVFIVCIISIFSCVTTRTQNEDAQIYAIVLNQLINEDDTFGGNLNPKVIYLREDLKDFSFSTKKKVIRVPLSEIVKSAISAEIKSAKLNFKWLRENEDISFDNGGDTENASVLIGFSNIRYLDSKTVEVEGSIYFGPEAAGGTLYTFKKMEGAWKLIKSEATWVS